MPHAEHNTGDRIPLCVDLDGTLVGSDALVEGLVWLVRDSIWQLFLTPLWLAGGKARFKSRVAARSPLAVSGLPLHPAFFEWLQAEHRRGRRLVLCTAANERVARGMAERLGIFEQVIASTDDHNLDGRNKARRLVEEFGEQGFDYAGNDSRDLHVWSVARRAIVVAPDNAVARRLPGLPRVEKVFGGGQRGWSTWLRALRPHQWAKNLLVFLPALVSHGILEPAVFLDALIAFLCFCLCASGTYLFNDLMDLESDRRHPSKRHRPLASGELPLVQGIAGATVLTVTALAVAWLALGLLFFVALSAYVAVTVWYSSVLKRIAMVDVLALAGLYTMRVLAGSAATAIVPSFWLLAFSMFLFLSLAMAKRYAELVLMQSLGRESSSGRGYTCEDLPLLQSCGVAAGYLSVMVLALYINSDAVLKYSYPEIMWLLCPLLLYWTSRVWIKTHRGQMHEDPVIFALKDKPSILTAAAAAVLIVAAV